MKYKICHITSVHSRYDIRIFEKECRSLAKAGYDVSLIVSDEKEGELCAGVQIHSTQKKYKKRLSRMLFAPKNVYKMALQIDAQIYHLHDPELLPIAYKLKKRNKKVIFDSHEFVVEQIKNKEYLPKVCRSFIANCYKEYEEKVYQKIDAVIIPCLYEGRDYFEGKYNKIVYIDNVPIIDEKSLVETNSRDGYACYVGALSQARGVDKMIEASSREKIRLVIAGRGMDMSQYTSEWLEYRAYVEHSEAMKIIEKSSMGLCVLQQNGRYEKGWNLPTKVYEYLLAGVPVVLSDFPYYSEINNKYQFGICVKEDDVSQIGKAMRFLIENPEEAKRFGQNGKRMVLEKYNWNQEEKKLLQLYEELIKDL